MYPQPNLQTLSFLHFFSWAPSLLQLLPSSLPCLLSPGRGNRHVLGTYCVLLLHIHCLSLFASQALFFLLSSSLLSSLLLAAFSVLTAKEGNGHVLSTYCVPTALHILSPSFTASPIHSLGWSFPSLSFLFLLGKEHLINTYCMPSNFPQ